MSRTPVVAVASRPAIRSKLKLSRARARALIIEHRTGYCPAEGKTSMDINLPEPYITEENPMQEDLADTSSKYI